VALVLLGSGSAEGRSTEIGATADQDRHRPDHQDHVADRPVVEQIMMQPLEAAAMPSMRGFPMTAARTAMLHRGCARLIDKASFTKPGNMWGERGRRIISDR
jgi:hypothetical protein